MFRRAIAMLMAVSVESRLTWRRSHPIAYVVVGEEMVAGAGAGAGAGATLLLASVALAASAASILLVSICWHRRSHLMPSFSLRCLSLASCSSEYNFSRFACS